MSTVTQCRFEVFGKVQGVSFRAFTQKQAKTLGLVGWCMNTSTGTVVGEIQGAAEAVQDMKVWLKETGSPSSRVDKIQFGQELELNKQTFGKFEIRR